MKEYASHDFFISYVVNPEIAGNKAIYDTADKYVIFAKAEVVAPGEKLPHFSCSVYSRAEWESDADFVEEITIDGGTLSLDNPRSDVHNRLIAWCV